MKPSPLGPHRAAAYAELRRLLSPATQALGPHWVALGAGCSLDAVNTWLRRPRVQLQDRTIQNALPRLRSWSDWVPARFSAEAELHLLRATTPAQEAIVDELRVLLATALDHYPGSVVALGCEVHRRQVDQWLQGTCPERQDDMLRAVALLRHMDEWPVPGTVRNPSNDCPLLGNIVMVS